MHRRSARGRGRESGKEMSERPVELQAILTDVRRRWTLRALLRAWTLGAAAAALIVAAGLGVTLLVARDGLPLVFTTVVIGLFVGAVLALAALLAISPAAHRSQIARFIEERHRAGRRRRNGGGLRGAIRRQSAHRRCAGGRCRSRPGGPRPRRDRVATVDPRACAEGWRRDSCARTGRGRCSLQPSRERRMSPPLICFPRG